MSVENVPTQCDDELILRDLHITHPGISPNRSGDFCDAACVCLARHHEPPTPVTVEVRKEQRVRRLVWERPDRGVCDAHDNEEDARRDGAYAVSLRCVESELGLVAVRQAKPRSGADWILAPAGVERLPNGFVDLDGVDLSRLEVSGTDQRSVGYRTTQKVQQLGRGASVLPGIAAVVRFDRPIVRIAQAGPVENAHEL